MGITSALEKLAIKLQETSRNEQIINRTDGSNIFQIALIIIGSLILLAFSVKLAIYYWVKFEKKISACILLALGIFSSVATFLSSLITLSAWMLAGMIGVIMFISSIFDGDMEETHMPIYCFFFGVLIMQFPFMYLLGWLENNL